MPSHQSLYQFLTDGISFCSTEATKIRTLYFPLCGPDAQSTKSSITPFLSGDIKIDKHHFLTKPASREDLRHDVRNFFVYLKGKGAFSLTQGGSKDSAQVEAGQLWHKLTRRHKSAGVELEALNFVPVSGEAVELMRITVKNISRQSIKFVPTLSLPIFGRGLANKHDHEHVTALLHRIDQMPNGVIVQPTMVFNEEGHKDNQTIYYVWGQTGQGEEPVGTFPTMESFCGDQGDLSRPQAVLDNHSPCKLSIEERNGKEAVGALRFAETTLKAGASKSYFAVFGAANTIDEVRKTGNMFSSGETFDRALEVNQAYWFEKTHAISFHTGDKSLNSWMQWVTLQPILRRIYGCSFLPDHDYGKGGKGWRDIWQDLLSLILIEPQNIRSVLLNNFAGVRIDGTNATIIGAKPGEFIADRNAITRVWMDHGVWPLATLTLYIQQTGDFDILLEQQHYFRDPQITRTYAKDTSWKPEDGNKLRTRQGEIYQGTILEHTLVQHLVQFFNVGEHNHVRLENADWNDGLDMAFHRGESVAFSAFYAGNLNVLADLLESLSRRKQMEQIHVAEEIFVLIDTLGRKVDYDSVEAKKKLLFETYFPSVQPMIGGGHTTIQIKDIIEDLRRKSAWMFEHIHREEKIAVQQKGKTYQWFNGYYDNQAQRVEGEKDGHVRMTLTGQVFPLMSGLAQTEDVRQVVESVDHFLKDKKIGGYRLNTDFHVPHYLDLGRAFGFAYGTKENGAFFSHMTVMYAYALYRRGFVREGFAVIESIYRMAKDSLRSKIYPGIPEYFDSLGQGFYHYLTGSASWLVLIQLTQAFGVRGEEGDLLIDPKLVKEQFDRRGQASVSCTFAGKRIQVVYENPQRLDFDEYRIKEARLNHEMLAVERLNQGRAVKISRKLLETLPRNCQIQIMLGKDTQPIGMKSV
ncbi:MAG: cellobiose phosphorylase [Candidatus Omnitrophota bacterium]|nr:cellobiose phosphorylase [Candidatus Omnitrophota bacterium]